MSAARAERTAPARRRLRDALPDGAIRPLLELLALTGVAITQPVLDVFGKGPDIFIARGARQLHAIVFPFLVALVPALLIVLAELLAGLVRPRLGRLLHYAAVGVLTASLAVQLGKRVEGQGWKVLSVVAVVGGVIGVVAVVRWALVRQFLRYLAVAPVAFVALFLFASNVAPFVAADGKAAAHDVEVADPAPILWIVLDELPLVSLLGPDDRVDPELFPNFAQLADESTWYRNHATVAPWTAKALPAMLTGRYPERPYAPTTADKYPNNLFTLLGQQYQLEVSESYTQLCPRNLCDHDAGAYRRAPLTELVDDAAHLWRLMSSPDHSLEEQELQVLEDIFTQRTEQARNFTRALGNRTSDGPTLDFLHVQLPHHPFTRFGADQRFTAFPLENGLGGSEFYGRWGSEDAADLARTQHLLQLQYTDLVLGRILDQLREQDRYDESLVVVTSDHGVSFTPGSRLRGADEGNYHEIMWTPLFVKAPGQRSGRIDDEAMRSIDLLPTVAEILGVEIPWEVDGRADPAERPSPERRRLLRWDQNELKPDEGEDYIDINGRSGFARVLAADPVGAEGDPELRLFQSGRFGEQVGRAVDEYDRGDPLTVDGRFNQAGSFGEVDLDASFLPLYVSGEVKSRKVRPYLVVAAVNGRVAAAFDSRPDNPLEFVYRSKDLDFDEPRRRRWWAMIPPALLRDGANQVELFVAEGGPDEPDGWQLRPLRFSD